MQIITLTTDFGSSDPFSGILKGIIYHIYPEAKIVDITHDISPQNINKANFVLRSTYRYFPKKTIHVCVVDPGVGSKRRPILIETSNYFFIGPDNGVFSTIIESENIKTVIELTNRQFWLVDVSQTFHGRDIFAPVSAHLAKGKQVKEFGKVIEKESLVTLPVKLLIKNKDCVKGCIQFIDHFGNIITNIPNDLPTKHLKGKILGHQFTGLVSSFSEAKDCMLTAIRGSSGYIEIFINKGSAAKNINAKVDDEVEIVLQDTMA